MPQKDNMTDEQNRTIKLAQSIGMVFSGINEDGELEFIGEREQWSEFERLKELNNLN